MTLYILWLGTAFDRATLWGIFTSKEKLEAFLAEAEPIFQDLISRTDANPHNPTPGHLAWKWYVGEYNYSYPWPVGRYADVHLAVEYYYKDCHDLYKIISITPSQHRVRINPPPGTEIIELHRIALDWADRWMDVKGQRLRTFRRRIKCQTSKP